MPLLFGLTSLRFMGVGLVRVLLSKSERGMG
jgi:hypothetical protein